MPICDKDRAGQPMPAGITPHKRAFGPVRRKGLIDNKRMKLTTLTDDARLALETLASRTGGLVAPSLRLGVTGLARSGKTVFLTALVHNLLHGGRLPLFAPYAEGRLARARLQPQPDDAVPRFAYEDHVRALVDERIWPESTRRIAELRVTIEYESASFLSRNLGPGRLHLDLVDYPGEWLLDLPLLTKDYATWAAESLREARRPLHATSAAPWLAAVAEADAGAAASEATAARLAEAFTRYLRGVREEDATPLAFPPGRFLMPGDLEGSPALTFAPLERPDTPSRDSLWAMMERRYEAYKAHVVRPFFRDHFARLDRQIVLVDVLSALNAGPEAVSALRTSLQEILGCFRPGRLSWLTRLVDRRVDRLMFAATKADHIHHSDHDRLEAILATLVEEARTRASFAGTEVDVAAIAAVRATREGRVRQGGEPLPAIIGTPLPGERVNGTVYDGTTEIALFPGDLPDDPRAVLRETTPADAAALAFLRFRPPELETGAAGATLSLPHIRLDRVLQFLIGDRLS